MMVREQQPQDDRSTVTQPVSTAVRTPRHDPSAMFLAAYLRELASEGSRALAGYATVRSP